MKKRKSHIIKFICFVILVCSFSGCLDENAKDQIPEEKTQETLQSLYLNYVAGLYGYVGGYEKSQGLQGTDRGVYDFNTLTSDEAMIPIRGADWYDGGFWQNLSLHTWGVNDQSIKAMWEYLYKVVILSNKSIEVLEKNRTRFEQQKIDQYIAEVRAFRGIYYYYLLDLFARIPITTSSTTPIKELKQQERGEVFNFVIDELNAALPFLSDAQSNRLGEYYGRVTKPVVYFVLAKMYLNAEIYTDNDWTDTNQPQGNSMQFFINNKRYNAWEAAIYYCDLISRLGYRLSENYEDNFEVFNESSVENIFIIPMDKRS